MKRWIMCLAALLAAGMLDLWPFPRADAGNLSIVETLLVFEDGESVALLAGKSAGRGRTLDAALEDLGENVPGQLFLRQVRRVIYCGEAMRRYPPETLPEELPMSALIYHAAALPDVEKLEPVLIARETRRDLPTLARILNSGLAGRPEAPEELEAVHADP